jgi:RHS repeat-associated protein
MKRTTAMILAASLAAATQLAAQTTNWNAGVPYAYDDAGNIARIGTDSHVYDWAGRLIQSETNAVQRKFEYDAFGNRKSCLQAGGTDCQWGRQVDWTNNRLAAAAYDPAGNVTQFDGHSYTYDAFNMQTGDVYGVVAREYVYTADDERIAVYTPGSGSWRWTLRDASGKVLRELTSHDAAGSPSAGSWSWVKDYVYRDGLLLASRQHQQGAPTTYHYHLDHLGTPRRVTDASDLIVGQHNYHAFGPELTQGRLDEPSQTPLKYTGHERDGDLDYMHARYYDMKMGRFLSVDPTWESADLSKPQTWNRYSYAINNPTNLTDPDGRCPTCPAYAQHLWTFASDPAKVDRAIRTVEGAIGLITMAEQADDASDADTDAYTGGDDLVTNVRLDGSYDIKDWSDYPDGVPKPEGPLRLRTGQEYHDSRNVADRVNQAIHRTNPGTKGKQIHEIQPVKHGGSPRQLENKIALSPAQHARFTTWWNNVQRHVERIIENMKIGM